MRRPNVSDSPWIVRQHQFVQPRLRLVCFPYAGGGASVFKGWDEAMPSGVEVVLVRPPGRESRLLETPFRRLEALVEALRPALDPLLDVPHVLFGHSMGAFVAFELCRDRIRRAESLPSHLFVSASRAPHVPDDEPPIYSLPDDEFVEKLLSRYDGIPLAVLESPELMELVLPNLKADLELVETYHPALDDEQLPLPIVALAGTEDLWVPPGQLARWRELTSESFQLHAIEGGHFFLNSNQKAVLALLAEELSKWLDVTGAETEDR